MFTLAHISDIHIGPMPKPAVRDLLSKRITGYINWQRNRAAQFSPHILNNLVSHMKAGNADHIVVTGDLINIALNEEIERAGNWLRSLGKPRDTTVICGNHDAYIKESLERAISIWQEFVVGDDEIPVSGNDSFPLLRRRGPCSIISVNSAVPTKPFDATGVFGKNQAERLEQMLQRERKSCRVVLIHHPPIANATKHAHRLIGDDLFREVIANSGAELILHGHTHRDTLHYIDGPNSQVPVVCVPAAGQSIGGKKPAAHYNKYAIEAKSGKWIITQTKYGYLNDNLSVEQLGSTQTL